MPRLSRFWLFALTLSLLAIGCDSRFAWGRPPAAASGSRTSPAVASSAQLLVSPREVLVLKKLLRYADSNPELLTPSRLRDVLSDDSFSVRLLAAILAFRGGNAAVETRLFDLLAIHELLAQQRGHHRTISPAEMTGLVAYLKKSGAAVEDERLLALLGFAFFRNRHMRVAFPDGDPLSLARFYRTALLEAFLGRAGIDFSPLVKRIDRETRKRDLEMVRPGKPAR